MIVPAQAAAVNPILVVTGSSNPYTTYLAEILHTEGLNELDSADISTVTATTLTAYDVVVLGDMSLNSSQATMLSTWVNGGGNLIAMHPDPQLAGLLGLVDTGSALSSGGYVSMNTAGGPGTGLVGQTIQFHGPAELYTVNGATVYASLYSSASTPTGNPALTLNQVGSGQAAAFAYDLARSVAYTRQGNPAWSGEARDAANAPPIRAYNLFYGAASFDPEPDWVDFNNIQIPQADEQQRLLANLILQMNSGKKPLPRFWYLPGGFKAAVVMTGDDHGSYYGSSATDQRFQDFLAASPAGCSVANWQCVRGTAYLFPSVIATNSLTNAQIAAYIARGFEFGVHVDSATDCQDWTTSQLDTQYATFLSSLATEYPAIPAPQTHRMHCISWSDYDSQPTIELKHGIRFDTTYYYWPSTWINDRPGMFTGSGMPMRYVDRNGNLINVYQATTQMTDESGQSYPLHINTLLDNALSGTGYYGVFTANMHNDAIDYPGPGADEIVASAQARGVPIVTSLQMLQWLDGRNGSSFSSFSWSGNVLSFSVTVGSNANNLQAMLPANFGSLGLSSLMLNSSPVSYQLQTIKGLLYATFPATAGTYKATYGGSPLFSVSGAISPAVAGAGASVTAIGPVTVSATPDNYGNYSLNGLPSGTYSIIPSNNGMTFTPASEVVTVNGANIAAVNFSAIQTCPCSLWSNAVTPGTQDANDPNPVELGVRFTSDVAGTITALRFYKGPTNTGNHIGNLWTNDGTLLATTTFTNETASGWQQQALSTPVAISPNTTYVVSYHTDAGNYSYDQGYFATGPFDNVPLHAPQDGSAAGANGVFLYGDSAFPTNSYLSTNYYVDVVLATATSFGISGTITGPGGAGASVSLGGSASATAIADGNGNYSFGNLGNGAYMVAASNLGFTFTPGTQVASINNGSVTGLNFATVTYGISGTISNGSGATVTLSGAANATVTADVFGDFSFANLANGNYTITPSKSNSTISPTSQAVAINGASVTGVSFSAASTAIYGISGTISGNGGNGATVTLSGAASATTTASSSGAFTFSNLANGNYTVAVSNSGFTFTPASNVVTINSANVSGVNFSTVTYTISGTIGGAGGNGATVTLSGAASATTTASSAGAYTFSGLTNGSYTVTPSKIGFTFTPAGTAVTVNNANATANFSTVTYAISGTISGTGGNGATVTLSGAASATTSASSSGAFTFSGLTSGSYTVTPSKSGYAYTPLNKAVTISNANLTGVNFTSATGHTISGTISGVGGNGATVTLSGAASATTTASSTGTYSFSVANGSYTVTPSKSGFTFTPTSTALTVNNANATANFSTVTYTISGTISGTGGNGATVTLSGTSSAITTASSTGTYSFTVTNGSYTVTPSKTGFTFTPASAAVTVNGASLANVNFSTVTYTISGTISGTGGNAATVTLSGASSATTTASSTGTYSFTVSNGSYTVTPSKSGFSFTPASTAVTVNGANVSGINFTSATATYTLSGTVSGTGGNGATVTLSGAKSATTTASSTGAYSFTGLLNGSYTVTPSKSGYVFSPASQAITVNGANVTQNFIATSQLAIDKTASADSTGILTSVTSASFSTTKTNELLLAMISANGLVGSTTVSSVTGGGLTWTLVRRTNSQQGTAEVWRAFSSSTLSNATVKATFSLSTAASITVVTFSGVDATGSGGSGAIGATNGASSSSGAQSASLTTTRSNSWVLGVGTDSQGGSSRTVGSNQTMIHQDTNGFTAWVQRQNATTTTSGTAVTINDTAPTNHRYDLSICEVLSAQ